MTECQSVFLSFLNHLRPGVKRRHSTGIFQSLDNLRDSIIIIECLSILTLLLATMANLSVILIVLIEFFSLDQIVDQEFPAWLEHSRHLTISLL